MRKCVRERVCQGESVSGRELVKEGVCQGGSEKSNLGMSHGHCSVLGFTSFYVPFLQYCMMK